MNALPSYGTGWTESEVLMDVVTIYNSWNGDDVPDFSTVQRRLQEKLNDTELIALSSVVEALDKLISDELARRYREKGKSAKAQPA